MIRLTVSFGSTRDKRQQLLHKYNKKIIQLGRYLFIHSFIRAFFHSLQQTTNVACEELSVKLTMDFPSLPLIHHSLHQIMSHFLQRQHSFNSSSYQHGYCCCYSSPSSSCMPFIYRRTRSLYFIILQLLLYRLFISVINYYYI